jgi:hypothetical protein
MKDHLIEAKSEVSRTNQLKILPNQDIAEQLYQYLFKTGKGIEYFELQYPPATDEEDCNSDNSTSEAESSNDNSRADFYRERHKYIKNEVKKRLSRHGEEVKYSDIQYFLSRNNGKNYIFFLSPNKHNSSWKRLFENNRERIFNLVFKLHLLSSVLPSETIKGFEELFFLHPKHFTKSKSGLDVWGQSLLVKYNYHDVLTLKLTRKRRLFLSKDKKDYKTLDGEDLGELIVYKTKNYYYSRDRDARRSNSIHFMDFSKDKEDEKYDKFKKTQLYHYQNLMNKLEDFLQKCEVEFEILDFQADHYLENPFIKNIEAVESLEIINNTGIDFTESEQQFLQKFLRNKGIPILTFYNSGKTVSTYEKIENEDEDDICWRITEVIPWSSIELNKEKNYLIFNKLLEEETGSMAYQREDGLWYPSTKLEGRSQIDFYSQLKSKYNYLDTGEFYSIQGINIPAFKIAQQAKQNPQNEQETNFAAFNYPSGIDKDTLRQDCLAFSNGQYLEVEDYLACYLSQQEDSEAWENFCNVHKLKIAPEFKKIIIEIGIKNWIKQSLINPDLGLTIIPQSFSEQEFWVIYVRSPKNKEAKAVAVQFLYKNDRIYLKETIRDINAIKRKFNFLRKQRNNSEKLINDQQYFVDESEKLYINCYTSDNFTPTLIGRHNVIKEIENETLKINKKINKEDSADLLPLIMYYNLKTKPINKIKNRICFDLHNESFIQYFVPPKNNINATIKKGFRVYHLIGKKYSGEFISTSELIEHPIAALHFSTLTQNVLKISDNSQSSLLQKIAKVLIEN